MTTLDEVLRLDTWVAAADDDREREQRAAKVRGLLFDGRSVDEIAEVNRVIADAQRRKSVDEMVAPPPSPPPLPVAAPKRARRFTRATVEEGIGAELLKMHAEASGTPFYDAPASLPEPRATTETAPGASIADRLARLAGSK